MSTSEVLGEVVNKMIGAMNKKELRKAYEAIQMELGIKAGDVVVVGKVVEKKRKVKKAKKAKSEKEIEAEKRVEVIMQSIRNPGVAEAVKPIVVEVEGYPTGFGELWDIWDGQIKGSKGKAYKSYLKLIEMGWEVERIIETAKGYIDSLAGYRGQHLVTWLNKRKAGTKVGGGYSQGFRELLEMYPRRPGDMDTEEAYKRYNEVLMVATHKQIMEHARQVREQVMGKELEIGFVKKLANFLKEPNDFTNKVEDGVLKPLETSQMSEEARKNQERIREIEARYENWEWD